MRKVAEVIRKICQYSGRRNATVRIDFYCQKKQVNPSVIWPPRREAWRMLLLPEQRKSSLQKGARTRKKERRKRPVGKPRSPSHCNIPLCQRRLIFLEAAGQLIHPRR